MTRSHCPHGAPVTAVTPLFTWHADGCAATAAAIARGELATPRVIIAAVTA